MLYVQFSDNTETTIVSWFASNPEPKSLESNLGEVEDDDPRYHVYYESFPEWMQGGMPSPVTAN